MYKYTRIEMCHTPPSLGGGTGTRTIICFSKSPKKARLLQGTIARDEHEGYTECPQIVDHVLERDGIVIYSSWD
jgi:hypothetical protein